MSLTPGWRHPFNAAPTTDVRRRTMRGPSMTSIGYASIRPGVYHVAVGNDKIGTARGDYVIGFVAFAINGRQIRGTFATPEQAAEVLALEVCLSDLCLTA